MNNTIQLEVCRDEVLCLEGLSYEVESRRDIITFMLENNMNTNTEAFKEWRKEYAAFYAEFQSAKNIFAENTVIKLIPKEWLDKHPSWNWNLKYHSDSDFDSATLTVTGISDRIACEGCSK